jgi:hypothetical protein
MAYSILLRPAVTRGLKAMPPPPHEGELRRLLTISRMTPDLQARANWWDSMTSGDCG